MTVASVSTPYSVIIFALSGRLQVPGEVAFPGGHVYGHGCADTALRGSP